MAALKTSVESAIEEAARLAFLGEMAGVGLSGLPVFCRRKESTAEPPFLVVLCMKPFEPVPGEDYYEADVKFGLSMMKGIPEAEAEDMERRVQLAIAAIEPGGTDTVEFCGFDCDGGGKTVDRDGLVGKIWTARVGARMK